MITSIVKLKSADELIAAKEPERVNVACGADGHVKGLSWNYNTEDTALRLMVTRRGGVWDPIARYWMFQDHSKAQEMLDAIIKRNPSWPIIGLPQKPHLPLVGFSICRLRLHDGRDCCLVPSPVPKLASVEWRAEAFRLYEGARKEKEFGLLIGSSSEIEEAINSMVRQGANCSNSLKRGWPKIYASSTKLIVNVTGWAVQITCDLSNVNHYPLAPTQKYRWDGAYPFSIRVAVPWSGVINSTRKHWLELKAKIQFAGLEYEGDDPDAELAVPASFDTTTVAGWDAPAPNGHLLHEYQKIGAKFCAARGMRALIGDEMGVGKTAQAIAAAEASSAPRVVVFCPANARYVWDREIKNWGGRGTVQHITSQLCKLDMSARWHIVTYDLVSVRDETFRFRDDEERQAFINTFPNLAGKIQSKEKGSAGQITLSEPLFAVPAFSAKRVVAWEKMMQRLRGELLGQILSIGPFLSILDEAHRLKNKSAKRTQAIQRIAASDAQMLALTGTPLRNNEHEAATLLSLLDERAATALNKNNGYTIEDIKDYLGYFMIRRTKAEVLPELPAKTRQRIDLDNLDVKQMKRYTEAMDWARECHDLAILRGESEDRARQAMQGGIETARSALALAKILGGGVGDLVMDVVQNKGCCVVFCAHHEVSDTLKTKLVALGLRVSIVDGRTNQQERSALVDDFQNGRTDVFIGGINAAGEAITLTRADTVIFVELDWVPAALLQAEDRIHRVGQRSNCQIIQLVARIPSVENIDEIMVDLIGVKMARIGAVLDEDGTNIIAGSMKTSVLSRILRKSGPDLKPSEPNDKPQVSEIQTSIEDANIAVSELGGGDQTVLVAGIQNTASEPSLSKRGRGRPKIYIDDAPPTAAEWSKLSNKTLAKAGWKRVMLRL
jgi:hypothetical protein